MKHFILTCAAALLAFAGFVTTSAAQDFGPRHRAPYYQGDCNWVWTQQGFRCASGSYGGGRRYYAPSQRIITRYQQPRLRIIGIRPVGVHAVRTPCAEANPCAAPPAPPPRVVHRTNTCAPHCAPRKRVVHRKPPCNTCKDKVATEGTNRNAVSNVKTIAKGTGNTAVTHVTVNQYNAVAALGSQASPQISGGFAAPNSHGCNAVNGARVVETLPGYVRVNWQNMMWRLPPKPHGGANLCQDAVNGALSWR